MGKLLTILFGLLALTFLAYFCVNKHSPNIEDDLVIRTQRTLVGDDKGFAKVAIDGRDLILTGVAPNETAREKAGEIARSVRGVRVVDSQLTLAQVAVIDEAPVVEITSDVSYEPVVEATSRPESEPIPYTEVKEPQPLDSQPAALFPEIAGPYRTDIVYKDGKVILSGLVADESSRLWLVTRAKDLFGSDSVHDQMKVVYGAPQNWHSITESSLISLASLDYGKASLLDTDLMVSGFAPTQEVVDQVKTEIADAISDNYKVTYDIKIAEAAPVVKEPQPLDSQPAVKMPAPTISCQRKFNEILATQRILFDTDRAVIKKKSFGLLDRLVAVARECPKANIEIGGHTDDRGLRTYNQRLSEVRAKAVMDYLKQKGIDPDKLQAKGYGELKPIADNTTDEGMAKNRRIEFKVREK